MLNKIKETKNRQSGFTIIEVLIVLAIAGLILLIVFLAIPTLQRNTRNAGRKQDAGKMVTAVTNYVSNNGGNLPGQPTPLAATANWSPIGQSIWKDAGGTILSQYKNLTTYTLYGVGANFTIGNNTFGIVQGVPGTITSPTANAAVLVTKAQCSGATYVNSGNTITGMTANTTNGAAVLIYTVETGSGTYNLACVPAN